MAADKAARRNGVTGARTTRTSRPPPSRSPPSLDGVWHNVAVRGVIYQVLVLTALCGLAAWMIGNAQHVLVRRGIATGFSFLLRESGFPISPSLIPYSAADSFLRAFAVGALNTLSVSIASVLAATLLGV